MEGLTECGSRRVSGKTAWLWKGLQNVAHKYETRFVMSAVTVNWCAQTVCAMHRFVLTIKLTDAQKPNCTSSHFLYSIKLHLYFDAAFTYLHIYIFTCLHIYIFTYLHIYIFTYSYSQQNSSNSKCHIFCLSYVPINGVILTPEIIISLIAEQKASVRKVHKYWL